MKRRKTIPFRWTSWNRSLDIADASQITDKADGDVKIDLGGVSGVKDLELPGSLLTGLSKNDKANSLTVTTEDASLKLWTLSRASMTP